MTELIVLRHGETTWSRDHRHTGRTDLPLTEIGERQAGALAAALGRRAITHTLVSPLLRARRTAELAGLPAPVIDADLAEWDYGGYEGLSSHQIRQSRPGWYLWRDGIVPGPSGHPGESVERVGARADAVLARARALLDRDGGPVALVGHGHILRVLTARWLGLPPADGRLFRLDTGTLSILSTEHDRPVIGSWNVPAPP